MGTVFMSGKYFYNFRPNGQRYDGDWRFGKQNGRGVFSTKDGKAKEAEWEDGRKLRWSIKNPIDNAISSAKISTRKDSRSECSKSLTPT